MPPASDDLRLILPDLSYAASYLAARDEGYRDTTSYASSDRARIGPEELAGHLAGLNAPERSARWADGLGAPPPFAHLWMVRASAFIGRVSVRYALTAKLLRSGGHIGYEIRPGRRGLGFGHQALRLGIEHLQASGINRFLLVCRDDNLGSIRVIEAAGGALENVIAHPDAPGKLIRRYWIDRIS